LNQPIDETVSRDRLNTVIGIVTALVAFGVYLKTLAPSISFWDCGEFVATSICFGIPHPPGTAVFILIGRIFSLIPFADDLAYRVNMISALSSAGAVFVGYFIVTRIIRRWQTPGADFWQRLAIYGGGIIGALCMAFNRTFWTNAVEAEVYGLTTLVSMLIVYLLVIWSEKHESSSSDKLLVLASYLAILGIGIHMSAFLVMPAGFIFIALIDRRLRVDVRYWISVIVVSCIMTSLNWFLIGAGAWLVISIIAFLGKYRSRLWALSAAIAFAALLGFSVQTYTPILSSHDPDLDMNNPDNWEQFTGFVERDQYGQDNMFVRMLHRRGELSNQFGDFPHMGFWGYFKEQYSQPGILFTLLLLIGLFGIYYMLKKEMRVGVFMLLLVLAGTIGLTLYMNFADGTQIKAGTMLDRLEVRDRDYFWTPGFAMFGLCIGLGFAALYTAVRNQLASMKMGDGAVQAASIVMSALILLPGLAIAHNYRACDRTYDTMPYDYAYNSLNSCAKNSVLFTAGDNDTFPLWALQYGLGIRRDVHIVNLSLLDVDWYALQMKTNLEALDTLITLDTAQIETVETTYRGNTFPLPRESFYDPIRKETRKLVPFQDESGKVIRVAIQLVEHIILNNQWRHEIYFANLPPSETAFNLREKCERVGLVYRIIKESRNGAVNVEETDRLIKDVYQFRNLDNPKYYRDETGTGMILSAAQKYLECYSGLLAEGDSTRALDVFLTMEKTFPEFWEHVLMRPRVDSLFGLEGKTAEEYYDDYLEFVDQLIEYAPDSYFYYQYKGIILQAMERHEEAIRNFEIAYEIMPVSSLTYRSLMSAYITQGRFAEAVMISKKFSFLNPLDESAKRILNAYGNMQSTGGP